MIIICNLSFNILNFVHFQAPELTSKEERDNQNLLFVAMIGFAGITVFIKCGSSGDHDPESLIVDNFDATSPLNNKLQWKNDKEIHTL